MYGKGISVLVKSKFAGIDAVEARERMINLRIKISLHLLNCRFFFVVPLTWSWEGAAASMKVDGTLMFICSDSKLQKQKRTICRDTICASIAHKANVGEVNE
jgi:hypothetical protein